MVDVYKPAGLKEALDILSYNDCTIMAGGTDLMVRHRQWAGLPPHFEKPVMLISELKELRGIERDGDYLIIGAACTLSELIESVLIPDYFKSIFKQMASPGIRNAATVGGNICNASPAGDCIPLLYVLAASIEVQSSCRKSYKTISEFILGPGKTALWPDELLTAVRIPVRDFSTAVYRKVGGRKASAISKLSFTGLAYMDERGLQDVRIAFGSVAPTVIRSRDIEEKLINMIGCGTVDIDEIVGDYDVLIKPVSDQRSTAFYRKEACRRLLVDFIFNSLLKEGVR